MTEITYTLNEICSGAFTVALSDDTPPCYTITEENYTLEIPTATITPARCATKYPASIEYAVVSADDSDVLQALSEDANGNLIVNESLLTLLEPSNDDRTAKLRFTATVTQLDNTEV